MSILSDQDILKDPRKIFDVCDKELVTMATRMDQNEHIRSLARAEQTRRQTEAIHKFNSSSTYLALVMIMLSIGMIIIGVPQFIKTAWK